MSVSDQSSVFGGVQAAAAWPLSNSRTNREGASPFRRRVYTGDMITDARDGHVYIGNKAIYSDGFPDDIGDYFALLLAVITRINMLAKYLRSLHP